MSTERARIREKARRNREETWLAYTGRPETPEPDGKGSLINEPTNEEPDVGKPLVRF